MSVSHGIQQRQALIILGMHRSGTSALTGTLAKLGAAAPRTLIPATPGNPKGFWESTELMKFHDRLLAAAGSRWNDWDALDLDRIDPSVLQSAELELPALLHSEFGDARFMLVKDPRMCRIFPVWERTLQMLGVAPKVVIPFRHPEEVARSLIARNRFSLAQAQLIWLRHVLDAECFTRGAPRVFIGYAELLQDWRSTVGRIAETLDIRWPRQGPAVDAEVDAYLSPSLRHHEAGIYPTEGVNELEAWVGDTHAALGRLVTDSCDADAMRNLDTIRDALDRASAIFAPVMRDEREALALQLATAKAQVAALKKTAKSVQHKEHGQSVRLGELALTIEGLQADAQQQAAAFAHERSGFRAEIAQLVDRVATQVTAAQGLQAEADTLDRLATRVALAVDEQTTMALRQRASLDQFHASRAWQAIQWLRGSTVAPADEVAEYPASDLALVLGSGLFDTRWYLARCPDAASCGEHPAVHFLRHGAGQSLSPGPQFDAQDYLGRYPDVAGSGVNPLIHYLRNGISEGRIINAVAVESQERMYGVDRLRSAGFKHDMD